MNNNNTTEYNNNNTPYNDYYSLIGASPSSTPQELAKAYRKRALLVHPDKNPNDPEAATLFQQLKTAYDLLSNEQSRQQYDLQFKAKQALVERRKTEDVRIKAMREALERRERAAIIQAKTKQSHASSLYVDEKQLRNENQEYMVNLRARVAKKRAETSSIHSSESLHTEYLKKLTNEYETKHQSNHERDRKIEFEKRGEFQLEEYEQYILTRMRSLISEDRSMTVKHTTVLNDDKNHELLDMETNLPKSIDPTYIIIDADCTTPDSPLSGEVT
jgi:curved DNA-binding protein CbpA